ncbi:uncharacterized protein LOC136027165 isoform X2 [Artemia franciscana]|uniref:uncharacterized protein LOC136027165 isoform X2 n=1 Tax=Artemia franciscana TaxID=6661 RepID=UPI0032DAAEF9
MKGYKVIFSLCFVTLIECRYKRDEGPYIPCKQDHLTVYKVILNTFWKSESFPKHYPEWRPPAQWSKLVGRSHDKSFVLFRLGQPASEGLRVFAETGRSDILDAQSQGEGGVYDEFNAPPLSTGVGRTEAEFFVDGNHSRVSLISKIVPSPDWFIGIDNFDLCSNGKWLDGITIEVDPIDAGTDSGLTFTSPDWPTVPRGVVYRMTAGYPNHPASSFYYPNLKKLPLLANFQFVKVKEYELSEVFHHSSSHNEVLKMDQISYHYEDDSSQKEKELVFLRKDFPERSRILDPIEKKPSVLESMERTEIITSTIVTTPVTTKASFKSGPRPRFPGSRPSAAGKSLLNLPSFVRPNPVLVPYVEKPPKKHKFHDQDNSFSRSLQVTERPSTTSWFPERESPLLIDIDLEPGLNYLTRNQTETEIGNELTDNNISMSEKLYKDTNLKTAYPKAANSVGSLLKDYRKHRKNRKHNKKKKQKKRPCRVGEWSEWSPCSKTCGIGESTRARKVIKNAKRGGTPCPALVEAKWCGSERACPRNYFSWK